MAFESLSDKLASAFKKLKQKGKLNENDIKLAMREVRMALLEADVNYKVAKEFIKSVSERSVGEEVMKSLTPAQQVVKIVSEELTVLMGTENTKIQFAKKPPTIIMMCGLQGSGKTTHSAKLAKKFLKEGHRPLLVACDIYRPAAIDQLKVMGERAGVPVFEMGQIDPEKIAQKAIMHAKDHGNDIVILDTAGRLHIDSELMDELKRVKNACDVSEILLVIDSMVGQDAVNVANNFNEALDISGVILTKLDGDTRGGAALSVRSATGKPIKFVGVGEKIEDLEAFYPDRMAKRILGMGDVLSFIEKAQDGIDEKEAKKTADRMLKNKFDMNDLQAQLAQLKKMGGVSALLGMMPGGNKMQADEEASETQFKRISAIINSMTKKERERPDIINPNRKKRIAKGSGTEVQDVNKLLKMFEQSKKMMKQFNKNPKAFGRRFGF